MQLSILSSSSLRAGDEYVFDDKRFRVVEVRHGEFDYVLGGDASSRRTLGFENAGGIGVREISPSVQVIMVNNRFVRFLASAFYSKR